MVITVSGSSPGGPLGPPGAPPPDAVGGGAPEDRLAEIGRRIASRYYDEPSVVARVAARVIASGHLAP